MTRLFCSRKGCLDRMQKKSKLALRLKMLRRQKGVTSQEVADEIGIKGSTYRRYEIDTKPKDEIYIALAQYFGVTVDYLMSGDEALPVYNVADSSSYEVSAAVGISEEEKQLLANLRSLSAEDFREVFDFVLWKKQKNSKD